METASKIAVIGTPDTVLPFRSIGVESYPVSDAVSARHALEENIGKGYGIIYIEEAFAREFQQAIADLNKRYRDVALTVVPGSRGGSSSEMEKMRGLVKRAIGIDIFAEK